MELKIKNFNVMGFTEKSNFQGGGGGGGGGEGSEKLIYSGDCLHSGAWGWYPNAHYALIANSKQI